MAQNEVYDYMTIVAKYMTIGIISIQMAYLTYTFAMAATTGISQLFSRKIRTQAQLEQVVKEEAEKLGINGIRIDAYYHDKLEGYLELLKLNDTHWKLHVGGIARTRSLVRHELYHIHDQKNDEEYSWGHLRYMFNKEPRAILYEAFGIKI